MLCLLGILSLPRFELNIPVHFDSGPLLKNNLKVQNNNFLRNNLRCCFWFCSNNFPFGSWKLLSDFFKKIYYYSFLALIPGFSGPRCPFTLQGTGACFELFLQNALSFFPAYVVERRCLQELLCWDLGAGGETAYQVFLRCEMFSGKIWNSTFTNGLGRVESLWQIVTAWQPREIPVDLWEPPSLPKVWGCFPSSLVKR